MISLGSMSLAHAGGVQEARRKLRLLLLELTDPLTATRIATATSEVVRTFQGMAVDPRLSLALDPSQTPTRLILDFQDPDVTVEHPALEAFFDSVGRVTGDERIVRAAICVDVEGRAMTPTVQARLRGIVEEKSRDLLMAELQQSHEDLQESFDNLRRTRSAKERMESELNIGRDIQMSMLPLVFPPFPHRTEFSVFATLKPAREVGGDFYDFFMIDEDRFGFCVGDVSGKGVPAALFMAVTKTLIKSRATNDFSTASIFTHVNDEIAQSNEKLMFVTLWAGILDVRSGALIYTNAGHNPPYLRADDGRLVRMEERHGPVIGIKKGAVYGESTVDVAPGDVVFVYTDGVTEARNPEKALYEEDRLRDVLGTEGLDSVEAYVAAVADDVWRFQGDAEQADDVTVLAVRYHGHPEREGRVLELQIGGDLLEIPGVTSAFDAFALDTGLPDLIRQKMKLVFDELLNNTISYGLDDEDSQRIDVHVEISEDRLVVTLADNGRPFNPLSISAPDTSKALQDRTVGGLGIHLVRSLMDEVTYTRRTNRNVLRLVKYLEGI